MGTLDIDPPRMLLTQELYETLARAELDGIRDGVATAARLYPETDVSSIEVAGGLVVFAGVASPLSKAYGVATLAPANHSDVGRITRFYDARGTTARVFTTPFTDPALLRGLVADGYAPATYDNLLLAADADAHALRNDNVAVLSDLESWIRASVQGFADRRGVAHDNTQARIVVSTPEVIALEARYDGAIVATAALSLRAECAGLFAGSTVPEYRGRGWQVALIRDRIARARDAGARIIYAAAAPDGISERNFHRCGFTTLYTRTRWDRVAKSSNH